MTTYLISPQVFQPAGSASTPYSAVAPAPVTLTGSDRIVVSAAAGRSLRTERLIIRVSNTDSVPHTVQLAAGDPVLGASRQRPLAFSIPAGSTQWIGPFDSSISTSSDGSLVFTTEAGHAGVLECYVTPKGN